jgi:hypothetical protein
MHHTRRCRPPPPPTTTDPFPHGPDMHAVALRYFQSQPGWVDPTTLGPS